jgi:hypothetical protein
MNATTPTPAEAFALFHRIADIRRCDGQPLGDDYEDEELSEDRP